MTTSPKRGGGFDAAPTRGSFNTEQRNNDTGWSTRSNRDLIPGGSQSKPATTESGWIAWDAPASASGTTDAWGAPTSWADKKDEPISAGNKFAWGQTVSSSSKNIEEKSGLDAWGQAIGGSGSGWDSVKSPEPSAGGWGSGWNNTTPTGNEDQQSAAVDAWGKAIKPTDGGWGSWGADQSSGKNETSAAAGGWGNAASATQDLAHDTLTGSTSGAWDTGEDAGNTGRGTDTGWGEKGKESTSTWSQLASGTKLLDAMDTSNTISGIDAWGSHHAAAPSRMPDIVHGSISGLRDPNCQDSASSVTRVSRSEQSKKGSDRDNLSTHHSNLTVPVLQYEIPAHEMSSIHMYVHTLASSRSC
jgi:hypothetical protein